MAKKTGTLNTVRHFSIRYLSGEKKTTLIYLSGFRILFLDGPKTSYLDHGDLTLLPLSAHMALLTSISITLDLTSDLNYLSGLQVDRSTSI